MSDIDAQDTHDVRFPGESDEYRTARNELLAAEIELRRMTEAVAERRRRLPLGGEVSSDYEFDLWDPDQDAARTIRLSELFELGKDTLFLYSMMFIPGPAGLPLEGACPNCTSIVDAVNGEARHISQRINVAVSAKVPIGQLRDHARTRGWRDIRLLSAANSTYNSDYHAEAADGAQLPMATVFVRRDGKTHHVWSSELFFAPDQPGAPRHVDFIWPLWSVLDCTPAGRGTHWEPKLDYS